MHTVSAATGKIHPLLSSTLRTTFLLFDQLTSEKLQLFCLLFLIFLQVRVIWHA